MRSLLFPLLAVAATVMVSDQSPAHSDGWRARMHNYGPSASFNGITTMNRMRHSPITAIQR